MLKQANDIIQFIKWSISARACAECFCKLANLPIYPFLSCLSASLPKFNLELCNPNQADRPLEIQSQCACF